MALVLVAGQLVPCWPFGAAAGLAGAVAGVGAWAGRRRGTLARAAVTVAMLCACAAAGSGASAWRHAPPRDPRHVRSLALPWRGEVEAVVVDGPWRTGGREHLLVDVRAVRRGRGWRACHGRVRVTAYVSALAVEPGDRVRARLSLRVPRNFRNPGSFDWVGRLARERVWVLGAVSAGTPVRVVAAGAGRWRGLLPRWRRRVGARIERLPPGAARAVLLALVVGQRGEITPALRARFVRAGVAHVLAISGLHVGIVAWVAVRLLAALLVRSRALASRVDVRAVASLLACAPAALYCALGGLGASALRAGVALAVLAVATAADRRPGALRVVAVVAILLTALDPGLARDVGFQLSLAAVVGLVLGARGCGAWPRRALAASLAASAATAPLLAHHFQELSLAGPVAGPLLLPFFGVGPVAAGVAGALALPLSEAVADACLRAAAWLLGPGLHLVTLVATMPGATVGVPRPSALETAGLYVVLATLVFQDLRCRRWILAVVVAATLGDIAWWTHLRAGPGRLIVTFLDVGQGDAAVVELPQGGILVVDGGGVPGSDFDVGRAVVAPYLRARKIAHVDVAVATHAHPDHFAGLVSVVATFRPRELWWPGVGARAPGWWRLENAAGAAGTRLRAVGVGRTLTLGGARLRVLHPGTRPPGSLNDSSVVLELTWAGRRVLLTGDVERRGERVLLAGDLRGADVVKVPHHGSATSSTPAFVRATRPAVAVVSVGAANRYGHPAPAVEARWRAAGACVLRTDRCGAVTVVIDPDGAMATTAVDASCACPDRRVRERARSPS